MAERDLALRFGMSVQITICRGCGLVYERHVEVIWEHEHPNHPFVPWTVRLLPTAREPVEA